MKSNELSLIVMSKNGSWRLERMLRNVVDKVSEIIVGIDKDTNDDTEERARRYTSKVLYLENDYGYIEPHIKTLFEECTCEWVLRLDDDELISSAFCLDSFSNQILDEFDLIGFPRVWVINADPLAYIGTGRKVSEIVPQYRLMKRSVTWEFTSKIHTPGFEMKEAYVSTNLFIYHLNLLDQSFEDRYRKYLFYESKRHATWNQDYLNDPISLYKANNCLHWPPNTTAPDLFCYDLTLPEPLECCYDMSPPLELLAYQEQYYS